MYVPVGMLIYICAIYASQLNVMAYDVILLSSADNLCKQFEPTSGQIVNKALGKLSPHIRLFSSLHCLLTIKLTKNLRQTVNSHQTSL